MLFQCEECFNDEYSEILGNGEDLIGAFEDYECAECHHTNRIHQEN